VNVIQKESLSGIPGRYSVLRERDIFPRRVGAGIFGYPKSQEFFDIGTLDNSVQPEVIFFDVFQQELWMK